MKRWLKYIKPYSAYFIFGPLCMIVEVIGEIVMPALLAQIIDNGIANGRTGYVALMTGLMILVAVLMMAGGVGGAYFGAKASVNFATDLRADVYSRIQTFSFSSIDKFSTGSLVTRLTNDITQLQNFVNMLLRMCLRSPGMLIGALIMSVIIAPKLSVILLVAVPVIAIVQFFIIKAAFPRFTGMQTKIDKLNSTVQENITNVRVIKSFVREEHEKDKFAKANKDLKNAGIGAMRIMILSMPVLTLIMNATSIAVLLIGGRTVVKTPFGLSIGNLTAFVTYMTQILMSLMMLTMLFVFSSRALASGKRVAEVLDEQTDISDENASEKERKVTDGSVEFKNVTFRYYKDSPDAVLKNINLKIEGGTTVGIIGTTGSGKSTLISMIPRLYDPDEGEVYVDGVNVKEYSLKNLRDGVSVVLQKNTLFSGTVAQNLKWGDEDASDDKMVEASKAAQADKFVTSFTGGYDSLIEQGGANVSGGQKQRLCIARALISSPKILIMDDSTSAVDTATEAQIRESLKSACGMTKIIIAQRISSVIEADMIIVMNDGAISGIGTHETLLKENEDYREIYYSQADGKEER